MSLWSWGCWRGDFAAGWGGELQRESVLWGALPACALTFTPIPVEQLRVGAELFVCLGYF